MEPMEEEEGLLRSVALQNAQSILLARQRAEEALERKTQELAHSLAMMRATLESTTDGILATDGNRNITGYNEKFVAMWGLQDHIQDKRDHHQIMEFTCRHFARPAEFLARVEAVYDSSPRESYDLLELKDGRFIERFSRIQFVEGRNVGRVWSFRDITESVVEENALKERIRLSALRAETAGVLAASLGLQAILQRCTELLVRHLDVAFARIWTLNEAQGELELQGSAGKYTHRDGPHSRIKIGQFKIGLIAQSRQPHLTNNVPEDPRVSDPEWARQEGMVAFAGYPLLVEDRCVGVMAMFGTQPFSQNVLTDLLPLADGIAQCVERKRTEEALRRSEARKTAMFDAALDCIISIDHLGRVIEFNPAAEQTFGYRRAEILGTELAGLIIPPAMRDAHRRGLANYLATGEGPVLDKRLELTALRADGHEFPVELTVTRIPTDGDPVFMAYLRDITARKQAELTLRRNEKELADFFENATLGLHWVAADGTILRANQAELNLLGYQRDEYVGRHIADFHVDECTIHDILQHLSSGKEVRDCEARMRCADGSIRHVLINSNVLWEDGQFVHTRCFTRDITERKRAEQRLVTQDRVTRAIAESGTLTEAAHKILRAICEHLGWKVGALWSIDENYKTLRCADLYHLPSIDVSAFEAISRQRTFDPGVGLPGRVWSGKTAAWIHDVVKDSNFPRASVADSLGLHSAFGLPILLNDQVLGVMEFFSDEIRQPDEDLLQMMTAVGSQIGQFIERKRAEEALKRWEHIFQQAGWPVAVANPDDNRLVSVNPAFAAMHGYQVEELVGQPLDVTVAADSRGDLPRHVQAAHTKGDHVYESIHVRKDGTRFPCLTHVTAFQNARGEVVFRAATFQDLTKTRAAEQAVRESEARFRQLADAMPQIVWAARPDGYIDYYNERWYEFTGFPRGEFGQKSWEPILHVEDVQRCIETYFGCIKSERLYQIEYRFKDRRSGGYRWFLGRAMPVRNEQGRVVRWFGTCTDIDDTKQSEQTTRFLADASAALAELTDYRSTLQRVASLAVPPFADWCAIDMVEAGGTVRRLAVTHSDPAKVRAAYDLVKRYPYRSSDVHGVMNVLRTGQSEWMPVIPDSVLVESSQDDAHLELMRELGLKSYICTPLNSRGKTIGVINFVTAESGRIFDATDLAIAEDLAHRAVIAIENASLLATLKEADRRKDEFLAMLAHELRNPLAPIRNAAQIFRGRGPPVPELQWATDVIDRQVHQMTRLVDDLLDVSRITRGKIELRKELVDLASVINTAVEGSRPLIAKWGHELTVSLPATPIQLEADPTRLSQVLLNLLNNSAKYTDQGGRIQLIAEKTADQVVIRVKDSGIGIPVEMLGQVFEMFTQVDRSMERSEGGLGIGLTLVQRLVELHGGSVEAFSEGLGKGSEFIVRLPAPVGISANTSQSKGGEAKSPAPNVRRILVVDDNRDAADSLGMLLRLMGNEVFTAHDGLEAVGAAAAFQPDVVLLDIGLPKLNGYEAARRIRQQEGGADKLLVALTGWGQEEDRRLAREAGFDHHMTKPVEFSALQKLLMETAKL